MQGKLIILRTRCFLHQNISQLPWFKEKTLLQSKFCRTIKSNISKVSKRGELSVLKLQKKARRNNNHSNTQISHRLRNDKCFGFGAKLTLTADEEDDKSIYNHREDAEEPAENTFPLNFFLMAVLNYSVVLASELFCC